MKSKLFIFNFLLSGFIFTGFGQDLNQTDCVRGQAEPVVKKDIYPNSTFVLQPDNLTAIETIEFENGDRLIIENTGCEDYILNFRFETFGHKGNPDDLKYWYKAAVRLLNDVKSGIDSPVNLEEGIKSLEKYSSENSQKLRLTKEIEYGTHSIQNFVYIDSISRISDSHFEISVIFGMGPL